MHLLGPWLLLLVLEYLAFSDSSKWNIDHPETLYAWEGACVWVPCTYRVLDGALESFILFHNPEYNKNISKFEGTRLYESTKDGKVPSGQKRVQFLGDKNNNNCTLSIHPVHVNDSGQLGLRMESKTEKWMEPIHLNVSERPFPPHIQLPPKLQESQEVSLTCSLNFSCYGYQIQLQWLLEGVPMRQAAVTLTSLSTKSVFTWSELKFSPQWSHHGKTVTCELHDVDGKVLSEDTVQLNVKHPPKKVTMVIENPTPIREGDTVTLSCNYNSSNPIVNHYEWKPRGAWEEPSLGVLKIQNVGWNNTAIACAACNNWCSWASPVTLNVLYAPRGVRVRKIKPLSEIHSGNSVSLQCDFSSSHPKEVQFFWEKNGSLLGKERQLNFDSISPEDAGSYSCWVNNSMGQTASKAWTLEVLYAPRRLRVSMSQGNQVMEGKTAILTCESDANPPVSSYTWFDWNNQSLPSSGRMLRLEPVKVQHSGAYWCQGTNRVGKGHSPLFTLTVYYSPETIGRRVAVGLGSCLAILILAMCGFKVQRRWTRTQSQQGLQENSSGQSFFVRNKKVRRTPLSEGPHSLGCYNPMIEDGISYATLRFPETNTPRTGDAETSEMQRPPPDCDDTVTYSVLQKRQVGDYENVIPDFSEDEGIHYSELIQFGFGERPQAQENVDYVILKH
ncbi:PREDICTED: B-cell receptor CD22 isoform X6 [Colobus angolensis palliatus]|uniref:B-cell receptor CD22 n=1 Tax=Colobus angolensis palliatus TaxID=336983 RepID=A0A2K5H8B2_COLAP|nr:PREDICTED: B-cell receptor CD22 isoform X6 [Colobus angolensis palliatus]